jgi:hypothetical protein
MTLPKWVALWFYPATETIAAITPIQRRNG